MRLFLLSFLFLTAVAPLPAAASPNFFGPIVPAECHCEAVAGDDGEPVPSAPAFGCILQTVQNVIKLAISLALVLATLALICAGLIWITSRGNPERISQGRRLLLNIVIGLVVMLSAWIIVDYVMKLLYSQPTQFGPWNSILAATGDSAGICLKPTTPDSLTTGAIGTIRTDRLPESAGGGGGVAGPVSDGSGGIVSDAKGKSGMNVPGATSYARSHALSKPSGACALYVRTALGEGGGLKAFRGGVGDAYQFDGPLQKAGFVRVYASKYDSTKSENLSGVRLGDVVVFQPVRGHDFGHVAIYDGRNWVSDYAQPNMSSNPKDYQGGTFAIYRP